MLHCIGLQAKKLLNPCKLHRSDLPVKEGLTVQKHMVYNCEFINITNWL